MTCQYASSGCNYPEGECMGLCMKEDHDETGTDDELLCNCAGDGFTVQELETGKCQGCGKAVVL